jgi:hypothetical protein
MITIEAPCCDQLLSVEAPMPDAIRCDDCAVIWAVADPEPAPLPSLALAA